MAHTQELGHYSLLGRGDVIEEVDAIRLGLGSSYAPGKQRWFEVAIYVTESDDYIVHTVGRSTMEGERDLGRVERTSSPYDVVELLTVRRVAAHHASAGDRRAEPYVPHASARALAQAAEFDDGLNEVYVRMVA